jgi:hypothetical protein
VIKKDFSFSFFDELIKKDLEKEKGGLNNNGVVISTRVVWGCEL